MGGILAETAPLKCRWAVINRNASNNYLVRVGGRWAEKCDRLLFGHVDRLCCPEVAYGRGLHERSGRQMKSQARALRDDISKKTTLGRRFDILRVAKIRRKRR